MQQTPVLIVGAGPFGISLAAYLHRREVPYLMVGRPMGFWKENMPEGMLLRSGCDWHLDPDNEHTIAAFLETKGRRPEDVEPLTLRLYLDYTQWFQDQFGFRMRPDLVERLDTDGDGFIATMSEGEPIRADNVVLALGFGSFPHIPEDRAALVPEGRYGHTCDEVDIESFAAKRVLIVGGRQSAFEWTALLREAGATAVHVAYRHDTPSFTASDWSWFNSQVDQMVDNPAWFRSLREDEKEAVNKRFWEEGRLKLEPWLAPRIDHETVRLWPHTEMVGCVAGDDAALSIALSNGSVIEADHVIFATGYKVDMRRIEILARGNVLARMKLVDGYPTLDDAFESDVPGLFITSMPAVQDFGLFFAFTISTKVSAHLIGRALTARLQQVVG